MITLDQDKVKEIDGAKFKTLTRYQFFRALLENGYKSVDIEAQIQAIEDENQRELILLGFQTATTFVRNDNSILAMQSILDWTDEQVDLMWEEAMTL